MAQDNYRKIKLLKLLDMLRHETDEHMKSCHSWLATTSATMWRTGAFLFRS